MKKLSILGSTGSIGVNTLKVVEKHPERFQVYALSARSNTQRLLEQCRHFKPQLVVLENAALANQFFHQLKAEKLACEVLWGEAGLKAMVSAPETDIVMAAIVGAAGFLSTFYAVQAGKRVLLANKEALIMGGTFLMQEVKKSGSELLPIDSEHNAVFQCLQPFSMTMKAVKQILLTASGGPFLRTPLEAMSSVSPEQAYTHPKWLMGRKISVDSATMMNKALEVIEAYHLFGVAPDQIKAVIHPQSIVHCLVEYLDGSVLAELANPDMRIPIAYGLGFPERLESGVSLLDITSLKLEFEPLDPQRFPCFELAYPCLKYPDTTQSAILSAANEVAVEAFLQQKIAFTDIYPLIVWTLEKCIAQPAANLEAILDSDQKARLIATELIKKTGHV